MFYKDDECFICRVVLVSLRLQAGQTETEIENVRARSDCDTIRIFISSLEGEMIVTQCQADIFLNKVLFTR